MISLFVLFFYNVDLGSLTAGHENLGVDQVFIDVLNLSIGEIVITWCALCSN